MSPELPDPIRYLRRAAQTAQNVSEVVRFGGLRVEDESSPFEVVKHHVNYRLRRYFPGQTPAGAPAVILIPPLMMTTEVWDVSRATSAVAALHATGIDPWVIDFGHPEKEPGGLDRTLTDHVLAVDDAVEHVAAATGRDVILSGYSQGGIFAYLAAAYRRCANIDSLVTFGAGVDWHAAMPGPISPDVASKVGSRLVDAGLLQKMSLTPWMTRIGFKLNDPAKSVRSQLSFLLALHDREALLPREHQRRFLEVDGWTSYPGPSIAEFTDQIVMHNRMWTGGLVLEDRTVTLADLTVPIMTFVGTKDTLGVPESVRAIRQVVPDADVYEVTMRTGHFGLVVGLTASDISWPAVSAWVEWRTNGTPLPDSIVRVEPDAAPPKPAGANADSVERAAEVGRGVAALAMGTARRAVRQVQGLVSSTPELARLNRIEQMQPDTRISLGLLLDEQADRHPANVCYLYQDRAYRQSEVKHRVDSIVRGLVSMGVRQGDHVGVLMHTRPSAFSLTTALSRLGATAVLLRPDGDVAREAALGQVQWVIADPDHVQLAAGLPDVRKAVLGGVAQPREVAAGIVDMELIDPEQVELPGWYAQNPHRAGDVAFILFVGDGGATRAVPITNRRWALSALGTATAASLEPKHTVYSTAPIHHSSCLLMSVGGAVAAGSRLAFAGGPDAATFWEETRRYAASHVSYTWTSLSPVVDGEPNPAEQKTSIHMFMGSGMPRNLWRRAAERIPQARVLEFYASAEGEAVLVNVSGRVAGSAGRPLPGSAEVRLAGHDLATNTIRYDRSGLATETEADEIGVLLVRAHGAESGGAHPTLRSVFEPNDAWRSTGELFLRAPDGDYWYIDAASNVVMTPDGPVVPALARFALESIPAVDLATAFGVPDLDGTPVLVAAVTVRPGHELTAADLDAALDRLPVRTRPAFVQTARSVALSSSARPNWAAVRKLGIPSPTRTRHVFVRNDVGHYESVAAGGSE